MLEIPTSTVYVKRRLGQKWPVVGSPPILSSTAPRLCQNAPCGEWSTFLVISFANWVPVCVISASERRRTKVSFAFSVSSSYCAQTGLKTPETDSKNESPEPATCWPDLAKSARALFESARADSSTRVPFSAADTWHLRHSSLHTSFGQNSIIRTPNQTNFRSILTGSTRRIQ